MYEYIYTYTSMNVLYEGPSVEDVKSAKKERHCSGFDKQNPADLLHAIFYVQQPE